ncbi:MAG: hypothetical protein RLZZ399_1559 [Verrucomicrobiota bacterium]
MVSAAVPAFAAQNARSLSYNRDIRPILSEACFHCHGPDEKERKGGLRLDVASEAVKPAKSGERAIVPGDPGKSELLVRIDTADRDEVMPPLKAHKKLSAPQKQLLRQWIQEGAVYEKHWAFVPLSVQAVPVGAGKSWARTPIDHFVWERLEKEGLKPSPEASRETLLRRVSLDLTGLPPTPAELDAFLADKTPDAYEKQVDRLLASPRYGERMAVDWLDAARFADTNGYQVDRDRELWAWREWVIQAFNRNLPFDQFTVEQIAGDLLPNPTLEQRIATGFHRNHMINEEGGVLPEEFLAEYTADRVETTASVWLAQTFNCARCHDHKYDPISQKDFYSLKAFFHNVTESGRGNYGASIRRSSPPLVELPAPEVEAKIASIRGRMQVEEKRAKEFSEGAVGKVEQWVGRLRGESATWTTLEPVEASMTGGAMSAQVKAGEGVVEVSGADSRVQTLKVRVRLPEEPVRAFRLEAFASDGAASFQWTDVKAFRVTAPKKRDALKLRAAVEGSALGVADSAKLVDGDRRTRVGVTLKPGGKAGAVLEWEGGSGVSGGVAGEVELEFSVEGAKGGVRWRVSATGADRELLVPKELVVLAGKEAAKRSKAEAKQLLDFWSSLQDEYRVVTDALADLKKQLAAAEAEIPTTLVMEEMKQPRPTFVLMRGAYDKPGEEVKAATPAVLPAMAADLPPNRLGLARWLVDPANPLPARVTVNRFWQAVFGTGLVASSEDFGAQGEPPSHPELLDWLAGEFIRSGWDVKAMMRLLVTSSVYRQSSRLTPELRERDPGNRLLARGPRFRLQAEFVRDQALKAAGLLVDKIGGPSVKPYHPPGLYEQVTAGGTGVYRPGVGEDLYRRSLYTYWKRSVPHPGMLVFDAPFRETCTVRRNRTNTPLQALNLMNDPTYVEAARCVAERMMLEGGASVDARLTHGFRLLVSRKPKPEELVVLRRAYERHLAGFVQDADGAKGLVAVGSRKAPAELPVPELAAYTAVASTVLNFDEWINKE